MANIPIATPVATPAVCVGAVMNECKKPENDVSSTLINVLVVDRPLIPAKGPGEKPHREYRFRFSAEEQAVHEIQIRFSELRAKMVSGIGSSLWKGRLSFPMRGLFFQNYTTNESNVSKRSRALHKYLQTLLNLPDEGSIIGSNALHEALSFPQEARSLLARIGQKRYQIAEAAREAERQRIAAIKRQQQEDCNFAQTFNNVVRNAQNVAPGQLTTISFPRPQRFELRNKMFGFGDATIKGPGDLPWFRMQRTNPSFFGFGEIFKSCHFVISNMSGEPLLALEESFSWMDYKYDLFRFDPKTNMQIPVCRIRRHWTMFSFNDNYSVQLYGPMAHHPVVQCNGRWPNKFTLLSGGNAVATVEKQIFSFTDKYHVQIAPNQDCLLFLGIACAIDRIHHEVEDERRRREN